MRDERILIVMRYLIAHKAEVFSYNVLNVTKIKLWHLFADHVEIVNQPSKPTKTYNTHTSCLYKGNFNGRPFHKCIIWGLMLFTLWCCSFFSVFSRHLLFTWCGCKNFKHLLLHYVLRIVMDENDIDFDIFSTI